MCTRRRVIFLVCVAASAGFAHAQVERDAAVIADRYFAAMQPYRA